MKRIFFFVLFLLICLFSQSKVYAEETGFHFPSTCETNGSSCDNMRLQDSLSNSWHDFAYLQEVKATFENFTVPDTAVIDHIEIKLRVKSANPNRSWYAALVKDSVEYMPASCLQLPCQYIQTNSFNTITNPTFAWYPNGDPSGRDRITGADLASIKLKVYQALPTDSAEIDTLLFNLVYHLPNTTPTPEPFLDLPWDYKSQGKTFENIIYNPNSWFDHHYPLQNIFCCVQQVLRYDGKEFTGYYRSHSGYDYGVRHGVSFNTPVLAAASGYATFVAKLHSGGAGNVIKIDHGNGYQTWYEHLVDSTSIVNDESQKIFVQKGQEIGKTGFTGNVSPQGAGGAHIHFSVFKDINGNGSFNDDYPYGLVDPLGWEGDYTDPWTEYGSGDKHGAPSSNLFIKRVKLQEQAVSKSFGGELTIGDRVSIATQPETLPLDFTIKFADGPFVVDGTRTSIAPSFSLNATTSLGEKLTQFLKPIKIIYQYSAADVINIKENTLLVYYLNELTNTWEPLPSVVDTVNHTLTTETLHFSHFAVMGELKDATAPKTVSKIVGEKGQASSYRSTVSIFLSAEDPPGGFGVGKIFYKLDDAEWKEYANTISVTNEGSHEITYLSTDKVDNQEEPQLKKFTIDKTSPEVKITYDLAGSTIKISGKDESQTTIVEKKVSPIKYIFTIADVSGNTLQLIAEKINVAKQETVRVISLQYNNAPPITFNQNIFFTYAVVDKSNKIKNIDQYFSIGNERRIYSKYIDKLGKTEIYKKTVSSTFSREEKPGIALLQLFTEHGTLKYVFKEN